MKISQDHYRHIHEQRDFTLENLSLAGQTDVVDYDDLRVLPEFDFESDAPVNSGDPPRQLQVSRARGDSN